ncbi:MAG: NADH-quinone oxidoreductase subunit NuoG [Candidatus Dormibacteria bacterium]
MSEHQVVNLTINGESVSVEPGTTVWEAARRTGIEIPYYCHHPKLAPVGACRMCVVEIEKFPKLQTSCTTPAAEGMVVRTNSALATDGQEAVLEFLLVNHPLDCPICDKGGECPLQDFTFKYGPGRTRSEEPRLTALKAAPLSDDIVLDQERCILCYRCTRYYEEVVGEEELVATNRGAHSVISTAPGHQLQSVFSGNIIELCPVGALTSRKFRFKARPWDMQVTPSVCAHCSVGCNLYLWSRRGVLERVTSRDNPEVDGGWLCDRGRFRYEYVNSPDRVRAPMLKGADGELREATWAEALAAVAGGLRSGTPVAVTGNAVTTEEALVLRRVFAERLAGAPVMMAGRGSQPVLSHPMPLASIPAQQVILVAGADPEQETPIVDLWLRRAATGGTRMLVLNPRAVALTSRAAASTLVAAGGVTAALNALTGGPVPPELAELAAVLAGASGPVGIVVSDGLGHEDGVDLATAADHLARSLSQRPGVSAQVLSLLHGANERGQAGLGITARATADALTGRAVYALGLDPRHSDLVAGASFLVWHGPLPPSGRVPDVLLPGLTYPEKNGTLTNLAGQAQRLRAGLQPRHPRREEWSALLDLERELGGSPRETDLASLQATLASLPVEH